jgi:hypothetical protein
MASSSRRIPLSTIGRPVDLSYPTNRAIAVITLGLLLMGGVIALVQGESWSQAALQGLAWGGSAFLAWALCRETDPDRWYSAFFATAGAVASTILLGPPSFLFLFWFLLAMRTINRSTGTPPGVLDFVALYAIKLWLGFSTHWTIPLLTFPTMFFADLQRFPKLVRVGLPLALPVSAVALGFIRGWHFVTPKWGWAEMLGLTGIALALIPVIASYRRVRSVGDQTGEPLRSHRVQWSLGWIAAAALLLTGTGTATIQDLATIWVVLAGTIVGWAVEVASRLFATSND